MQDRLLTLSLVVAGSDLLAVVVLAVVGVVAAAAPALQADLPQVCYWELEQWLYLFHVCKEIVLEYLWCPGCPRT